MTCVRRPRPLRDLCTSVRFALAARGHWNDRQSAAARAVTASGMR
jgi:hypothetical protein